MAEQDLSEDFGNYHNVVMLRPAFQKAAVSRDDYEQFMKYMNEELPDMIARQFPAIISRLLSDLDGLSMFRITHGKNQDEAPARPITCFGAFLSRAKMPREEWDEYMEYFIADEEQDGRNEDLHELLCRELEECEKALGRNFIAKTQGYQRGVEMLRHHFPDLETEPVLLLRQTGDVRLAVKIAVPEEYGHDVRSYFRDYLERRRNPGLKLVR